MTTACSSSEYASILQLVAAATDPVAAASAVCSGQYDVQQLGPVGAVLSWSIANTAVQEAQLADTTAGLDTMFCLTSAYLVFVLQMGFALYAAGIVRARSVSSILMKHISGACISAVGFYLVGFAFAYGSPNSANGFIGYGNFALSGFPNNVPAGLPHPRVHGYELFVINWAYCAASTCILSGSIAERATLLSYALYAAFFSAWVYPVAAHWNRSPQGWLSANKQNALFGIGCIDFAGSGVVHTLGGFSSLCAAVLLGPRVGRFDHRRNQRPYTGGHNPPLYLLGTLLLWFGWYGFNPGSMLAISSGYEAVIVGRTAVTTTLAASAGALTSLLLVFWRTRTWDMLSTCSGSLAGLVAITSGCSVVEPWAAIICGFLASPCNVYSEALLEWWRIDDPVGAFPLHGACGIWGVLFVGFFAKDSYIFQVYGKPTGLHHMGWFYGGYGQLMACQVISLLVIIGWVVFWVGGFFAILRRHGLLRVTVESEAVGLDLAQMGQASEHGQQADRTTGNLFDSKAAGTAGALALPAIPQSYPATLAGGSTTSGPPRGVSKAFGAAVRLPWQDKSGSGTAAAAGSAAAANGTARGGPPALDMSLWATTHSSLREGQPTSLSSPDSARGLLQHVSHRLDAAARLGDASCRLSEASTRASDVSHRPEGRGRPDRSATGRDTSARSSARDISGRSDAAARLAAPPAPPPANAEGSIGRSPIFMRPSLSFDDGTRSEPDGGREERLPLAAGGADHRVTARNRLGVPTLTTALMSPDSPLPAAS